MKALKPRGKRRRRSGLQAAGHGRHRINSEKRLYGTVVTPLPKWLAAEVNGR